MWVELVLLLSNLLKTRFSSGPIHAAFDTPAALRSVTGDGVHPTPDLLHAVLLEFGLQLIAQLGLPELFLQVTLNDPQLLLVAISENDST